MGVDLDSLRHFAIDLQQQFVDNLPLSLIFTLALLMLTPLVLFRWGTLDPFLNPEQWKRLALSDKKFITHNTCKLRFNLPHATQPLGLPLGQHITVKGIAPDGKEVMRPYTPVTDLGTRGYVEFVIKVYPEGRLSQIMKHLNIGEELQFKGPKGRFEYDVNERRALGMIAGGTGITPMYQVAKALLQDPQEYTTISLIYANLSEADILIKDELDKLASTYARFKVFYVLNTATPDWSGGVGFVTKEMIQKHLPKPEDDVMILRCGPPAMNKAMAAHLNDLGYIKDMLFEF